MEWWWLQTNTIASCILQKQRLMTPRATMGMLQRVSWYTLGRAWDQLRLRDRRQERDSLKLLNSNWGIKLVHMLGRMILRASLAMLRWRDSMKLLWKEAPNLRLAQFSRSLSHKQDPKSVQMQAVAFSLSNRRRWISTRLSINSMTFKLTKSAPSFRIKSESKRLHQSSRMMQLEKKVTKWRISQRMTRWLPSLEWSPHLHRSAECPVEPISPHFRISCKRRRRLD